MGYMLEVGMLLRSFVLSGVGLFLAIVAHASDEQGDRWAEALAGPMSEREQLGESVDCSAKLPLLLSQSERDALMSDAQSLVLDDYAGYIRGWDTILENLLEVWRQREMYPDLIAAHESQKEAFREHLLVRTMNVEDWLSELKISGSAQTRFSGEVQFGYLGCVMVNSLYDSSYLGEEKRKVFDFLKGVSNFSSVGYFDVELKSCRVTNQLNTGNQFANPEVWEGSRFLVLDVAFKNKDKESRIPLPGSAFISVDGSIYEFDQPESIMARGYGVPLQGINPLVTYRTKLVYLVPDESFSDVFWQPGRNSEGKRLYCSL